MSFADDLQKQLGPHKTQEVFPKNILIFNEIIYRFKN